MPKEKPPFELSERLQRFATDAAGWQLDAVERDVQQNPSRFAEYAEARKRMDAEETALIQKLGSDALALEPYNNAYSAYAAALAIEMYLHGVLDGACMYKAFDQHELPREEGVNQP